MQRRLLLTATLATGATALAGCAGPQVSDYSSEKPVHSHFSNCVAAGST